MLLKVAELGVAYYSSHEGLTQGYKWLNGPLWHSIIQIATFVMNPYTAIAYVCGFLRVSSLTT